MTQLQVNINTLHKSHPKPSKKKLDRRVESLKRMASFYETKAVDSKDGGVTFYGYAATLMYAVSVLNMYDILTRKIAELADDDETPEVVIDTALESKYP